MTPAEIPANEAERVAALHRYQVLDTPAETELDDFTALAAQICGTPMAVISLVDSRRQWFKSRVGLDVAETPRDISFSGHVVHGNDVLIVPDALQDPRFADNPLVIGPPHVRFYAGGPLTTPAGYAIGSLCVMDRVPRQLTPQQRDALVRLGRQIAAALEHRLLRSRSRSSDGTEREKLERELADIKAALDVHAVTARVLAEREAERSRKQFHDLFEFAPDAIVMTNAEGRITMLNRQAETLFGYAREELVGEPVEKLMPESSRSGHGGLRQAFLSAASPRIIGAGRSHLRALKKDGTVFPVDLSLGPIESSDGMLVAVAVRDIAERVGSEDALRQSLHEKELLLREIHHRVKNNLQIISSLLAMQLETATDPATQGLLQESIHRVRSMGLIHERLYQSTTLARIDFGEYARALTGFLFRSYDVGGAVELVVEAEATELNIETAMPCGLILNELVSNALKYAFKEGRAGKLLVAVRPEAAGGFSLTVRDTGPGLPPDLDLRKTTSLGMRLVTSLTKQIKGKLTVQSEGGASFRIDFEELTYAAR